MQVNLTAGIYNVVPTSKTLGRRCINVKKKVLCLLGICLKLLPIWADDVAATLNKRSVGGWVARGS